MTAPVFVESGLRAAVHDAWPLLTSVLLMMTGSGLLGSLLGVRAEREQFGSGAIGLVLALFYVGYVAGSAWAPGLIRSVGHIRVFAALTSLASATVLIHGVWLFPLGWMGLRFLTGACIAGLFVTTESWLQQVSTTRTRATILSVYNSVVTGGLAVGSLLLNVADVGGLTPFVLGSVIVSVAAVPIALAPRESPVLPEHAPISLARMFRSVPLGVMGASLSGICTGTALGFGAVYASRAGFDVAQISQLLAATLVGGTLGQVPLGRWSDRTDRRVVMLVAAALISVGAGAGIVATAGDAFAGAAVAAAVVGAGAFSLYGMSFAHVGDYLEPGAMAAAGAHLLRVNGLSAASGPLVSSLAVTLLGAEGFFVWLAAAPIPFFALTAVRLVRRRAVDEHERASYTAVPSTATMAVVEETMAEVIGVEPEEIRRRARRFRVGNRLLGRHTARR
ncbi:MAG TPA: MFS transporter [Acidimicrobiales bacterium]